jgi:hypothetical protein
MLARNSLLTQEIVDCCSAALPERASRSGGAQCRGTGETDLSSATCVAEHGE